MDCRCWALAGGARKSRRQLRHTSKRQQHSVAAGRTRLELTSKKRAQGNERCAHVVDCRPLVLKNVEADVSVHVYVRVEARRDKFDVGRRARIIFGKVQGEL
eukprot:3246560-Rhodomonas_salina.1